MEKLTLKKLREEEFKNIKNSLMKYLGSCLANVRIKIKKINDNYSRETIVINIVHSSFKSITHIYNIRVSSNEVEAFQHYKVWKCDGFIEFCDVAWYDLDLIKQVNYIFGEEVQPK